MPWSSTACPSPPGATLLQFSSEYCAPCRATARVLGELAESTPGVAHVEVDVAERPELAARFSVLQTPTTVVIDAAGRPRVRVGGVVSAHELRTELARLVDVTASAPA